MKMVLSTTLNVGLPKIFRFILNMNNQDCTMLILSYKDYLKWLNYFRLLVDKLVFARSNSLYAKIDMFLKITLMMILFIIRFRFSAKNSVM